ncbi:MAG: serine protease, partial [Myxococcota bacterium]|nr:serine protease [Myxococcota bacterium]
ELDAALPGRPLPLAPWDGVHVGMPVVIVGTPSDHLPRGVPDSLRGTLPWAVSEGVVSGRGERAIQTDARIGSMLGSAIVTCAGELVALLGTAHESFGGGLVVHAMPAVPALADLVSRLDRPEGYGGRWNLTGGLAIAATYEDPEWLWGASLNVGLIGLDAFILGARFSYFFQNETPVGTDVLSQHDDRFRGDAFVGWRQILAFGRFAMHFELALGASVTSVRSQTRRGEIVDDMGTPALRWRDDETQFWSVRPMAVVNLLHGPMLISYTIEVDIDREHVVHVFQLGARF